MTASSELVTALARHFPACRAIPQLGEQLVAACAIVRQQLPWLAISDVELLDALGRRAPPETEDAGLLERARLGDLALALAAGAGDQRAISQLEQTHGDMWRGLAGRYVGPGQTPDDLLQILRTRLFVGDVGGAPKILEYGGFGHLENWLRVMATRTFVDLTRRKDRTRERPMSEERLFALASPVDLGLDLVKAELRGVVASALRAAVAELAAGERHLLRQHLVAGLTIDQLCGVLGIHRSTAARRIARAREQLVHSARQRLMTALALPEDDLHQLVEHVVSQLDVSLATLLASEHQPEPAG